MDESVIHIIDGSFEGLLTSVFEAYADRLFPTGIYDGGGYQQSLCESPRVITTDSAKAGRVLDGIVDKLGATIYRNIWTAYLSCDPERYTKIMRFLKLAFAEGRGVTERLTDPAVFDIFAICRNVGRETGKLAGFIRFSVMENNVQFAQITPEHNQIPLLMQHFADRLMDIPFVIYDSGRHIAGIYDTKEWHVADAHGLKMPDLAADEEQIRELWKTFYKTIAIEARLNYKLQRNHMPLRYRRNMTEHV
ncbi:MAG: TIGR03915 family putative DNA repair protein [Oscillospiraceae bacterium]|nr:TIGR03915 family putative DNA repair protein [Oscillospiraceae bacterium]